MRYAVFLLLLLAMVPVPAGSAQPEVPGVVVDDPVGDTRGVTPTQGAGFVDIVRAQVDATDAALAFQIEVADLQTDAASGLMWELWLEFAYRDSVFHLVVTAHETTVDLPDEANRILWGEPYAELYRMGADWPEGLGYVPAGADAASRSFNASIAWDAIVSASGHRPMPGEALRIVRAATLWSSTLLGSPHRPAPMPVSSDAWTTTDEATFPEGTFLTAPGSVGDLSLATTLPIRSSNGEATTMHWPVEVGNRGGRDLDVKFSIDANGAEGRIPPGLKLAPGSFATINVYVTVPFNHEHGLTRLFPFTASAGPGDRATLNLGIDYPLVAQPAGHHPDLWLHGAVNHVQGNDFTAGPSWMNTQEVDERANAALLMPREETCPQAPDTDIPVVGPVQSFFDYGSYWAFALDPYLAIGLDGRLASTASLDLELVGRAAALPGTLHVRLMTASEVFAGGPFGNATDDFRVSVPVPAAPGPTSHALHLDLPMPPSLDLVAPSRTENLVLGVLFCLASPPPTGLPVSLASAMTGTFLQSPYAIRAGGHLQMALDEYHDIVPVLPAAQGLALDVEDAVRRAAPGATVLWQPRLSFASNATGAHAVRLFGTGGAHASLLGPDRIHAPAQANLQVAFVVPEVPAGQVFDLLLDVTHEHDPARAVGLRLSVVVDPSEPRDDAALVQAEAGNAKESPPLQLGLLLVALTAFSMRRRI